MSFIITITGCAKSLACCAWSFLSSSAQVSHCSDVLLQITGCRGHRLIFAAHRLSSCGAAWSPIAWELSGPQDHHVPSISRWVLIHCITREVHFPSS